MLLGLIALFSIASQYAEADFNCPKDLASTDEMRAIFLDGHNELRRNIAEGKQENKQGLLGPAKNMYELKWDCEMERKAQQALANCKQEKVPGSYGQNTIALSGGSLPDIIFGSLAISQWTNTIKFVGIDAKTNKYVPGMCQFANMALAKTTKLGCAYKQCGGEFLVTCIYDQCGTLPDTILWENGPACKKDGECTTHSGSKCSDGLCTVGSNNDNNKPAPVTVTCANENGMSNSARQKFLDMHNHFRSLVAKGEAKDKIDGTAPKAAKMKKMVYDCKVEETAMKHAKKCKFEHSKREERPNLGENVWQTTAANMDKMRAAEMASRDWFGELEKYGVGKKNYFDLELVNRKNTQIGHYTQMVWQDSYKLGCYVEWCSGKTLAVCQYGPEGNRLKSYIYEVGEPCTKDTNDCKCSKDEGLCIV